jgi:hypothetical protein
MILRLYNVLSRIMWYIFSRSTNCCSGDCVLDKESKEDCLKTTKK